MTVKNFYQSNPSVKTYVFDGFSAYSKADVYYAGCPGKILNAEIKDIVVKSDDKRIRRGARNSVTLFI